MGERIGKIERKTKETDISISLGLDGKGIYSVDTGIAFFDHMLEGFSKHGFFDLTLKCKGDIEVDGHHTVEDCGLALGKAISEAVGDKKGIRRYGHFLLPMDDALVACAIDLCDRPYLGYDLVMPQDVCGDMEMCLVEEFFRSIAAEGRMNIHLKLLSGNNSHHIAEAAFKAFAKALDMATSFDERIDNVLSTKGSL